MIKKFKISTTLMLLLYLFHIYKFNILASSESTNKTINVNVPAAVVIDMESGRVLYEKNSNEKRPMASLTKIMTSILLVENCDMDELIEIPSQAASIGGSTVGLKKGDKVSARSLLYGMLLPSR